MEKMNEFADLFPEHLKEFVLSSFKFLLVMDGVLYYTPPKDRDFMLRHKEHFQVKSSLMPKFNKCFGVEKAEIVRDERALFLEAAIKLAKANKIELKIGPS